MVSAGRPCLYLWVIYICDFYQRKTHNLVATEHLNVIPKSAYRGQHWEGKKYNLKNVILKILCLNLSAFFKKYIPFFKTKVFNQNELKWDFKL
jgi:hypothetical protein